MITKYLQILSQVGWQLCWLVLLGSVNPLALRAQTVDLVQQPNNTRPELPPPQDVLPTEPQPQPSSQPPQSIPSPDDLLKPSSPATPSTPAIPNRVLEKIEVKRFEVNGSTVFSQEQLAKVLAPFTNKTLSFAQLLQARSAVTQLYIDEGYITSGAYLPPQRLRDSTVKIQVVEGSLEDIKITGTEDLNPNYIRSRLARNTSPPLNRNRLLESLQLLQQNPLIENLTAELSAGAQPGTSLLEISVTEADSFDILLVADNGRVPSIGSVERGIRLNQANLFGFGDGLGVEYVNTDGSNAVYTNYTIPVNPDNGTIKLTGRWTETEVIEQPFDRLDITGDSLYLALSFRQPIVETPTHELALGITASRQSSQTSVLGEGFPLSPGANDNGETRLWVLRFFQEWTQRSSQDVLAVRSQFNLGVDAFDATINNEPPDSRFFAWQGQGQYVRSLATDTLLVLRSSLQLTTKPLVPLEQFTLGGLNSVRGYRQDVLLTDNGAFASAEVRLPILRIPQWQGVLQITPFVEFGAAWNSDRDNTERTEPDPNTIASTGLGLLWQQGDRFTARFDWGIPLISVDSRGRTWQENGLYFSIQYNLF